MKRICAAITALAVATSALAPSAFAWGAAGHEMLTAAAIDGLSKDIPAFLKTKTARFQLMLLGREPDRSKGAGRTHDSERDLHHFIDMGDDNKVGHLFALDALPATRNEYEVALAKANYALNDAGLLPYAMIDNWQQVAKDFAYWRASKVGAKKGKTAADRAFFKADMKLRELILIRDIGVWSHFVGDASQPLHTTEHYNGWDKYPDPIPSYPPPGAQPEVRTFHAYYEGTFVRTYITQAEVRAAMTPYTDCACPIWVRAPQFIAKTLAQLVPLYELAQSGAIRDATPAAKAFTIARLAAGATEVRDQIEDAWKMSATMTVGYPVVSVADIESGKVILTRENYGRD